MVAQRFCLTVASFALLCAGCGRDTDSNSWRAARKSFVQHITPELERRRVLLHNPRLQQVEVKDSLLSKYLPDYRLFRVDGLDGMPTVFFVNRQGEIREMGQDRIQGLVTEGFDRAVVAFLRGHRLFVSGSAEAVEVVELGRLIQGCRRWRAPFVLKPRAMATGWYVPVEYVGPPAGIDAPPCYEITVDAEKHFTGIRDLGTWFVEKLKAPP